MREKGGIEREGREQEREGREREREGEIKNELKIIINGEGRWGRYEERETPELVFSKMVLVS